MRYLLLFLTSLLLCTACNPSETDMAIEDYTTYTVVDTNSDATITSDTITFDVLNSPDFEPRVYKDLGAGAISGDFEHTFRLNIGTPTSGGLSTAFHPWAVAATSAGFEEYWESTLRVTVLIDDGATSAQWVSIDEYYDGSIYDGTYVDLAFNTDYYCTVTRDASTSEVSLSIYSDASRTALVGTSTLTLQAVLDYRYIYAYSSGSTDNDESGEVGSLDIGEVATPETTGLYGTLSVPEFYAAVTQPTLKFLLTLPALEFSAETGENAQLDGILPSLGSILYSGSTLGFTLPDLAAEFDALQGSVGAFNLDFPFPESDPLALTGSNVSADLSHLQADIHAYQGLLASLTTDLRGFTFTTTALQDHLASLNASMPTLLGAFSRSSGPLAGFDMTMPFMMGGFRGEVGGLAQFDLSLNGFNVILTAAHDPQAQFSLTMPEFQMFVQAAQQNRFDSLILRWQRPN